MQTHPFEPIFDSGSKVLILGSFPSVSSRADGFYYGHKKNRFWDVLSAIYNCQNLITKEEKIKFLIDHNIAVYDAAYKCEIKGSSDSSICEVVPADLSQIFDNANIKMVFANGNKSYEICKKFYDFEPIKLPSTSPLNIKFDLEKLKQKWSIILEYTK
ncbi:G:T/U mismatch-specific DNA glycosylase [Campylobacter iguaniorum]|uniref:G:T/U mismatch-specific DNA glycosylase n=1 Tax=Campylobacter iguaniorum TaxID=1244531 RepID=A0A076FCJ2_9BACT|nr:DNA-deoxyinosine glycosylase [Campylobacter iguaniorum]AII15122.1 G:T/U mismatch-specific DNA glycosylase [Campylobacter iguaniorum]ALV24989.1 G:T/U mismatch-specific DNA glycosylase [Campylobacter iguaniorum]